MYAAQNWLRRPAVAMCDTLAGVLTVVRGVNKTDVHTLGSTFGSVAKMMAAPPEQLAACPGMGPTKVPPTSTHTLTSPRTLTSTCAPGAAGRVPGHGGHQGTPDINPHLTITPHPNITLRRSSQVRRIFEAFHEPFKRPPRQALALASSPHTAGLPASSSTSGTSTSTSRGNLERGNNPPTGRSGASTDRSDAANINPDQAGRYEELSERYMDHTGGPPSIDHEGTSVGQRVEPLLLLPSGQALLPDTDEAGVLELVGRAPNGKEDDAVRGGKDEGSSVNLLGNERGEGNRRDECIDLTASDT
eukprot:1959525-Pyramimonas_sp.AAC.1